MRKILAVSLLISAFAVTSQANSFTFITPTGSTDTSGDPVSAEATFTTGSGTVSITLSDLLVNPKDVGQLISDLFFTLSNGVVTTATLASSSGQQITVNSGGSFTLGPTASTGWGLNTTSGLQLDDLGFAGPAMLIIGPPGTTGYSNANPSIAGNGPHNPFENDSATFVVDVTGVTAGTNVTGASFSFGTTSGDNVVAVPLITTPEPTTITLLGITLLFVAGLSRMRKRTTTL